jgi:2-succinyl-6-hydroxy-2,4-cyclohexadiene-1-carboxylate synthase
MEGRYITIRGLKYYVAVAGVGQPVLLLHGFTGSCKIWMRFVQDCPSDYQLIMPDLPGHGLTDCPLEVSRYSMAETILDLAAMLDAFHIDKCFMLGYSMGGRIALSFALAYPERISGLVLESATPGLAAEKDRASRSERDKLLAARIETVGISAFADEWAKIPLFASQRSLCTKTLAEQHQIRTEQRGTGLANSLRGIGTGFQPSNWSKLTNLHLPVLLITGVLDEKFRKIAVEMMNHLQDARHTEVADAGHTVHLEQPIKFASIVSNFLSGLNSRTAI